MKKVFIFSFFLILHTIVCGQVEKKSDITDAQDTIMQVVSDIKATAAYVSDQMIVLRWAPSAPDVWRYSAYYGYKVERAEFDTLTGQNAEWKTLVQSLKPVSLEEWRKMVTANPEDLYLQVSGQAHHGERSKTPLTFDNLIQKSDELNNYYSAAILAAEFSRQAGIASALRYEDTDIGSNKVYVYRISSLCPADILEISPGLTSVSTYYKRDYPAVEVNRVYEGEKSVELYWDKNLHKLHYTAYNIYRSESGKNNFIKLNSVPVAYTAYKNENEHIFRDSLTENYRKYDYRIEGLTSFATKGPLSKIVTAMGRDRTPPKPPYNVRAEYKGKNRMILSWETHPEDSDIAGFRISRSNKIDEGYVELTETPLGSEVRTFMDTTCSELVHNYYFVGVFDKEGNVNVAMPTYGTIIDSMPPMPPKGIQGTIDTNGVVTLTWKLGPEPDLKGYYIHFANNNEHTFINKTGFPVTDTIWRDTIPLNVLTEEIHYKIVAIDQRFNYSEYSEMLTLKKPDKVPPVAPVFYESYNGENGIVLSWYNSTSHDAVRNVLERRAKNESTFQQIYTVIKKEEKSVYTDNKLIPGTEYEYRLYAVDDAGLRSPFAGSLYIKAYENKAIPAPENVNLKIDTLTKEIILTWQYGLMDDIRFIVYRSVDSFQMKSHKVLKNIKEFREKYNESTEKLAYTIQAVNARGWRSDFTEPKIVVLGKKNRSY